MLRTPTTTSSLYRSNPENYTPGLAGSSIRKTLGGGGNFWIARHPPTNEGQREWSFAQRDFWGAKVDFNPQHDCLNSGAGVTFMFLWLILPLSSAAPFPTIPSSINSAVVAWALFIKPRTGASAGMSH